MTARRKKETEEVQETASAKCSGKDPESLSEELDALRARCCELEESSGRQQRLLADLDNERKRLRRDMEKSRDMAVGDLLRQILPVIDNFERAIAHLPPAEAADWAKGFIMIHSQLIAALGREGMEEVSAEGLFDPEWHEAVLRDETSGQPENTITAVLEKGYKYRGRLLRPSKVRVSAGGQDHE